MQYDVRLPVRVALPDGTSIDLRELHEENAADLRDWFRSLSLASRYQRFHSPTGDLSDVHWRYLTNIDGQHHLAIVALHAGAYIGVARLIELDDDARTAEITFLVDDRFQNRRVGSLLRDVILAYARLRAYRRLFAYVLRDNQPIRRLLARSARTVVDRGDVLEIAL